jgi:hypothetical protein
MFIVSPIFGLIAVATVVATYIYIQHRGIVSQGDDVRSGMFGSIAEWAAKKVSALAVENARTWKPNLLVPLEDPAQIRAELSFLLDSCSPEGSLKLLGLATAEDVATLQSRVEPLARQVCRQGVFCTWSIIDTGGFTDGILVALQALRSAFFRPNLLFLTLPEQSERHRQFGQVIVEARRTGVGILFLGLHPEAGLGTKGVINLWVRSQADSSWDPEVAFEQNSLDLTLLMGYRLSRRWNAQLNLITVVAEGSQLPGAQAFLDDLADLTRIPPQAKHLVLVGPFDRCAAEAPQSDIDIMGLQPEPDFDWMLRVIHLTRSSCLFVGDSGRESARA